MAILSHGDGIPHCGQASNMKSLPGLTSKRAATSTLSCFSSLTVAVDHPVKNVSLSLGVDPTSASTLELPRLKMDNGLQGLVATCKVSGDFFLHASGGCIPLFLNCSLVVAFPTESLAGWIGILPSPWILQQK